MNVYRKVIPGYWYRMAGIQKFGGYQMHSYDNKGKDTEAKLRLCILSRNLQN